MRILARPKQPMDTFPWRPMDNRERRAVWAMRYYLLHKPYGHGLENPKPVNDIITNG